SINSAYLLQTHPLMNDAFRGRTAPRRNPTQNPNRVTSLGNLIAPGIAARSRGEVTLSEGTLEMLDVS
ncbi:MAG: hypothetical protein ACO3VQ_11225, partial [Ilumatobacteraceae bacterium]